MTERTKTELLKEVKALKKRIAELEKCESTLRELDDKIIRRSVELAKAKGTANARVSSSGLMIFFQEGESASG